MAPQGDRALLQEIGHLVNDYLFVLSIAGVFSGISIGLGVYISSLFWEHAILRSLFKKSIFASIILASLTSLVELLCYAQLVSIIIRAASIKSFESKISTLGYEMAPYLYSVYVIDFFMLLIADFIVLWRTWTLLPDHPWAISLPSMSYVGSLVSVIAFVVLGSNKTVFMESTSYVSADGTLAIGSAALLNSFSAAATVLLFSTSLLCTAAVLVKLHMTHGLLWCMGFPQRPWSMQLQKRRFRPGQPFALFLAGSGLIFGIPQLVDVIVIFAPNPTAKLGYIVEAVDALFFITVPLYPTLILQCVNGLAMDVIIGFTGAGADVADTETAPAVHEPQAVVSQGLLVPEPPLVSSGSYKVYNLA